MQNDPHTITTLDALKALYGEPNPRSISKELDHITPNYQRFIERSPFVVVASVGEDGLDCSPRGDPAGFVRVRDQRTVLIPDRRGNNRVDTLSNLVRDPRISLLFLIPGAGETVRINGRATISTDPTLCESFAMNDKLPRSVLIVSVHRIYFQCQKALVRSGLWDATQQVQRGEVPSAGAFLKEVLQDRFDDEAYDRTYPEHMKETIY